MPQPTRSDVHVNRPLTDISIAYIQDQNRFIADQVFPNISVPKQSDTYFSYNKEYWFRSEAQERLPGSESAGSGFAVTVDGPYYARIYAVHKDIDDATRANADTPLDLDRDASLLLTQQMLLKKEKLWMDTYFKTGVWTGIDGTNGTVTGSTTASTNQVIRWSAAGSDPVNDVTAYANKMDELTGLKPNTLVINPHVEQILLNHPVVLDRIKYTQRGIASVDLLAALFNVERVLVARATNNTAKEGATTSMAYMAKPSSKNAAALLYVNRTPSLMQPSAGYTFSWNGLYGAGAFGTRTKRFRMDPIESDRIEMEMAFDMKVIASDCGIFFNDIVA